MRRLFRASFAVCLALAASGCGSARPAPVNAPASLPADLLAFVGQKRLLAGAGDAKKLSLKAGEPLPPGDCDVAVEVLRVGFQAGQLTLRLWTLGRAEVTGRARGRKCGQVPFDRQLSVAGLAGAQQAREHVERLLLTPEALLAARDQAFDLSAEPAAPTLAARTGELGDETERRLGRQVTAWPKPLLAVHALVPDPTGKVKQSSEVAFAAVVGADGHVYRTEIRGALSVAHEEAVRGLLTLWRYEPARKGTERVAAWVDGRLTLQIY